MTLREDLLSLKEREFGDYLDVVCYGDFCKDCKIFIDNKEQENKLELFTERPKVYTYDENGYFDEKRYPKNICFVYQLFPNKSGTNMFLEYKQEYYIFYPKIHKTKKFNDYGKALKEYDPKEFIPTENSQFYAF